MTWLPVPAGSRSERDAVFGLKPDVHDVLREMLAITRQITDERPLESCRLRLAQMMGARAEMDGDAELLTELTDWRSSSAFSDRERAALSYAEQYHLDHHAISDEQKAELARCLSPREFVNFVWALHVNDSYARALALLDIAPDPQAAQPRAERAPVGNPHRNVERSDGAAASGGGMWALIDPAFLKIYGALGRVVVKQKLIDDVTSEAVRLHNASHQGCQY